MRRRVVDFIHRISYATLFAMVGWYSCVMPPERAWQAAVQKVLCYALTYPPAVVSQLTYPLSGMDLFFTRGSTWCDFCSPQDFFWYHLRFAVPVYVALFYVPTFLRFAARRDKRLFKRIMIGLLIYVVTTTIFFAVTSGSDRRGDIRIAALWFVILSGASAFGWSRLDEKLKAFGVAGVILIGAWPFSYLMTFIAPKVDGIHIGYYIANLFVLTVGVTFVLGMTWLAEYVLRRLRERSVAKA